MLFRLFGFGLSVYYMVNILRLPRILARHTEIPRYLKGYTSALGLSMLFYVCVVAFFTTTMMMVYVCIFSVVNMYLFYRTLESMALRLPKPEVQEIVDEEPQEKDAVENDETFLDVEDDFNEANCKRFERVEHFMRHQREWKDNTFGRDRLCEATGINRHLLLQCLRSQGYNNCHDYINTYRISALKRGVSAGTITTVNDCVGVGFGSPKTARSCFERMEGISLDDYLKERTGEIVKKNTAVSGLQ
jgi:AraC-like DNA-binding protein